ncbi:mechanosensitive ion channel family protein [Natranaerobius thermophilus]|uniref:MscS Mechanosensitive ion channel n=1 Tax=Natranaerobius thermophilus (strain ATCC BAA-1301 / DSM 18059 / JW/NM-WN-LF) TaxID=457570 RepID=B2A5Q8_NATTJ|nr:mechanosensitive ion channel family protein [Natranaerobius thermophilus]ACB84006.1 MscS Mechanosensitive ion channel [Natranaerobius thermophilus JW/NM-WN-LF]
MKANIFEILEVDNLFELGINLVTIVVVIILAYLAYQVGLKLIKKVMKIEESKYVSADAGKIIYLGLKTLLKYGLTFLVILISLEIFEFEVIGPEEVRTIGTTILKIIGIIILAKITINLGRQLIDHVFDPERDEERKLINERRKKTLNGLLKSLLLYVVYFLAGMMILENLGIRTSSILAGVGVLGLAVSFGAQSLIKDVITGFFIMFEDQYSVGEYVVAADVFGEVQELGLRTTRIREWTGQIHIIPNGEIGKVTNYSRGEMMALITVGIAYEEDINKAIEVLAKEGKQAAQELTSIVTEPVVQGVTELADSSVNIRVICETIPGEQWAIERELRRRFKMALDREGIEIPYPRRVIIDNSKTTTSDNTSEE